VGVALIPATPRSRFRVGVLLLVFFVISLLTNIIGPIVPDLIRSFHLSLTLAALLPFSFFFAYAILSIPAGLLVEKWGEKRVKLGAFALALGGAWFATQGLGAWGEVVGDLFFGAGTLDAKRPTYPVLSLQLGAIFEWERLP
jgi:FHS family L-fucose permease-like MFS transporter